MQSKLQSFVEACVNTVTGLILAFAAQTVMFKVVGINASGTQNAIVILGMTVVSVIRSYVIRRFFTNQFWKRIPFTPAKWKEYHDTLSAGKK